MLNNDVTLASTDSRQRIRELLTIAQLYYRQNMTQLQIAHEIGYSRATVSRMLQEAQERGIVRISINDPLERLQHLESQLINIFGLTYARVSEPPEGRSAIDVVPRSAATLLIEHTSPDALITVSNGEQLLLQCARYQSRIGKGQM